MVRIRHLHLLYLSYLLFALQAPATPMSRVLYHQSSECLSLLPSLAAALPQVSATVLRWRLKLV